MDGSDATNVPYQWTASQANSVRASLQEKIAVNMNDG